MVNHDLVLLEINQRPQHCHHLDKNRQWSLKIDAAERVLQVTLNSMYTIVMYVAINWSMLDFVNNMEPSVSSWQQN